MPRKKASDPRCDSWFLGEYIFRARPHIRGKPRQEQSKVEGRIAQTSKTPVDQTGFAACEAKVVTSQVEVSDAIAGGSDGLSGFNERRQRGLQPPGIRDLEAKKWLWFALNSAPPIPIRPVTLLIRQQRAMRGMYVVSSAIVIVRGDHGGGHCKLDRSSRMSIGMVSSSCHATSAGMHGRCSCLYTHASLRSARTEGTVTPIFTKYFVVEDTRINHR